MSTFTGGVRLVLVIVILGVLTLAIAIPAAATQFSGGKGLTSVQFPSLLPPGALNVKLHGRFYATSIPGIPGRPGYTLSDASGAISFNFGFTRHVEVGLTQILYQDLNFSRLINPQQDQIPDDTYLRLKVGNYPFTLGNAYFKFGLMGQARIRTGLDDNIYLEPYVSHGLGSEIDVLLSYYVNPLYEENAPALHLNMGYLNHNDSPAGQGFLRASQEFTYGLAFVYPLKLVDFFLENHGSFFTKQPPLNAWSRENYIFATPGLTYKMFYGLNVTLAADFLLLKAKDTTVAPNRKNIPTDLSDYPNYPSWRGNLIVSLNPSTLFNRQPTFSKVEDPKTTRKLLRERKSLFEWVVDNQQGLEYIDVELEKIKAERKKAEQDLEKLKQEVGNP
ncbi:MAG: hypothetical protein NTW14_07035 [bacterium]|nr:hypothetical protein [bacterium]